MTDWLFFPNEFESIPAAVEDWSFGATAVETWSLTRSSSGYGRGPDGKWFLVGANQSRPYFDPVTFEDRGILIEPESYQTVYKPRNGVISLTNSVRSELPDEPCPFGFGVYKLSATAIQGNHSFNLLSGGSVAEHVADNTDVTGQWIIKPEGINRYTMFCQKKDSTYASANFDMRGDGSVTGLVGCSATIERDVLGFYRMSMSLNSGVGLTTLRFGGQMALDDGTRGFLGDGFQGFLVAYWGIERGLFMSSPSFANGTITTVRAADVLTSPLTWIGTGPKSFGIEFTPLVNQDQIIFDAGISDSLQLRIESGSVRYVANTQGQAVAFLSGPTAPPGLPRSVVVTAGFNEFFLGHSGSLLGFDRLGAAPSALTAMRIGALLSGSGGRPMAVKRLKFWNQALSEAAVIQYSKELALPGENINETEITVQPSISVPAEQNTITILITLTQQDLAASVNYRTVGDSAVAGVDFIEQSGNIQFSSGELSKEITIQLGARSEVDKTFKLELSFPRNALIDNSICLIHLVRAVRVLPETSLDVLFGESVGNDWTLIRPFPAPRRDVNGIWGLVAANAPAQHWIKPNVVGVLVDALGHDQCLYDSVLPYELFGATQTIDLTTPTMVGTRSVIVAEDNSFGEHGFGVPITLGNPTSNPVVVGTADPPTGDFTVWLTIQATGRTKWLLETKGRDNVWHTARFTLTGAGTVEMVTQGIWAAIERDAFFPNCYRIAIGSSQAAYAGVDPEFILTATDDSWNSSLQGATTNTLRIIHMQVESRLGWGSPLVTAAASAKVVRTPDDLRPNGTWYKRDTYSIGVYAARLNDTPSIQQILHIRDALPYEDDYGYYIDNGVVGARNTTGAIFNGDLVGSATTIGNPFTVILASDPAKRFALFQDGSKKAEQSLVGRASPKPVDAMKIGSRLDGTSLQACALFLQRIRYWTGALADYEGIHYSANLTAAPPPVPVLPPVIALPTKLRVKEGELLTVPITKSGAGACSITYTTRASSALFGIDYNGVGPVVMNFATEDTVKTFTVQTIADTIGDTGDIFTVEITNPVNCELGNRVCEVTIFDPPVVAVPLKSSVKEGTVLSLTLTKTGEGSCSVSWETNAVSASVGNDYVGVGSPPAVLNFSANETSKTINVTTLQDNTAEQPEIFNVKLSSPVGCSLGNSTCEVTITDDDVSAPSTAIYKRSVTFGGRANAGIGKAVYRVTKLTDDNSLGTLRYGINLGSRHIIFEVGGTIQMTGDWVFSKTDLLISGETAPYPGITIRGTALSGGGFRPGTSKRVCFSHLNFERCHDNRVTGNSNSDVFDIAPGAGLLAEDIEFRHCSFFWGNDELVSVWATGEDAARGTNRRISFTDCLFAEPLWNPQDEGYQGHYKTINGVKTLDLAHNYGMIFGARSYDCDVQYSMYTDHAMRGPFIDGDTSIVLANNIALNCDKGAHISVNDYDQPTKPYKLTVVGYLAISGPNSKASDYAPFKIHSNVVKVHPPGSVAWLDGIYAIKGPQATITPKTFPIAVSNEAGQRFAIVDITKVSRPIDIPNNPVPLLTAAEIRQRAIDNIGPHPKNRNPNLKRKIEHLKGNTGAWIHHQSNVQPADAQSSTRFLNGNTSFPDGTPIPAYPVPNGSTVAADMQKVREWLELFLSRIQYD